MKSIQSTLTRSILALALLAAGAGYASAHYDHDNNGWFDSHHHHHAFVRHNGHRGYWDTNDHGSKIFINI